MMQYRRLTDRDSPMLLLLQAQIDERTGRPARAVMILDQISKRIDRRWETMIQLSRGRCYEALWDEARARQCYLLAIQSDPGSVVPRLALAKLKLKQNPRDAVDELARALVVRPGDPALLVAMASALLRAEAARPAERRNWTDFDAALKLAAEKSKGTAIALLRADRLALSGQRDEAMKFLQDVVERSPRNAGVAIALADGLIRLGKADKALGIVEQTIARGDQANLRIARARALSALNRGRDARDALIKDVERLPLADRLQVWIALGQHETSRGNSDGARLAFVEWRNLQPEDPRPRLILLELALSENNEAAIRTQVDELRVLAGQEQNQDLAHLIARAKMLLWQRDVVRSPDGSRDTQLEEASRIASTILAEAPELPVAHMLQGQVFERQGRANEAIDAYQRAHDRGIEAALPRLVDLLTRGRRFDTLTQLRSNAAASRNSLQVDLLSAQTFLRMGDRAQASAAADQVARDLPDSAEAASWQARMLNHLGQVDDAETVLRALAERRPSEIEPWLDLIRAQASRRRAEAVAETIKRALAEVKFDPSDLVQARCLWAGGDLAGADRAFASALRKKPNDPTVRIEAARFYEQNSRPVEAEECLRVVLAADPGNRAAARQLAVVLASRAVADQPLWDRAWATLGPEPTTGESPEDRLARCVVLSRCPDPGRATTSINKLEDLVADLPSRNPVAAAARDLLARLYLRANQPEKAGRVAAVSAALGASPDAVALYAEALAQSKQPEAAAAQLDRLAVINPGDRREAGLRVRLSWDGNRPVESARALEQAYGVRENLPGAEGLGREAFLLLADSGKADDAALRLGQKLAAKNPALSWMPALILNRGSRHDEALALLTKAVSARGGSIEDLRETGRVAMQVAVASDTPETFQQVDAILAAALRAEPNADEIVVMLAMLRHLEGKFDEETKLYRTLLAHRPESYLVLNNLAWALSEGMGRPEEGLRHVDELIKIVGRDTQALDTRAMILARMGRIDEALRDMETVVRAQPSGLHHFHLARVYRLAGRIDDAKRSFDQARRSGLTPREIDPAERGEMKVLSDLADGSPTGKGKPTPANPLSTPPTPPPPTTTSTTARTP